MIGGREQKQVFLPITHLQTMRRASVRTCTASSTQHTLNLGKQLNSDTEYKVVHEVLRNRQEPNNVVEYYFVPEIRQNFSLYLGKEMFLFFL